MITIKSKEEIEIMLEGGRRLAEVMEEAINLSKAGIALYQLEENIEKSILQKGGQPSFKMVPNYHWASCLNINQGVVHGIPNKYHLKENDYLSLDIGFFYKDFHTDMSRTIKIENGKDKKKEDKFLEIGKKALEKAIEAAKSGNRVGHISEAIEKTVRMAGYSSVEALTGHGIGHSLHENPPIPCFLPGNIKSTPLLKTGMTLAIEVIYNQGSSDLVLGEDNWTIETADGKLAGLFEDTVAIFEDRSIVLTKK
ncbi:MAG: type I methionyl aminopeptidase [Candidatus Shapirobacteria bacterium]|nr:type I methionyl aminopeptidase [Candidatus Shapirobacteria bacterium]